MVYYNYTQSGCTFIDSINVIVNPQPYITSILPSNSFFELCPGDSILQSYSIVSALSGSIDWIIGNNTYQGSTLDYYWNQSGIYIISATETINGCTSPISQTTITIDECPEDLLYIANAFTPDGDEDNPVWKFYYGGDDMLEFNLYLYNRWGQLIWECHDVNGYWDGTYQGRIVPLGVYIWRLEYKIDNFAKKSKTGHVSVLK